MLSRVRALPALLLWLLSSAPLAACPLCKETVAEESGQLSASYNSSTLIMLGVLFSLAGFAVVLFARAARTPVRGAEDAGPDPAPEGEKSAGRAAAGARSGN